MTSVLSTAHSQFVTLQREVTFVRLVAVYIIGNKTHKKGLWIHLFNTGIRHLSVLGTIKCKHNYCHKPGYAFKG